MVELSREVGARFANMSFVCACLVVCIHSGRFFGTVTSVAVPFFFLCSGQMLSRHVNEKGWYCRALRKRFYSVCVPYLIWCMIPVLIAFPFSVVADILAKRPFGTSVALINQPLLVLGLLPNDMPLNTPLWYLRTLMIFVLISPVINWLVRRLGLMWIGFLFGCELLSSFGVVPHYWGQQLFPITGILYFSIGWFLDFDGAHGTFLEKWSVIWAICIGMALLLLGSTWTVLVIPPLMYVLWLAMPKTRFPDFLLSGTFLVFVMHMVVLNLFQIVFKRFDLPILIEEVISWFGSISFILSLNHVLRRKFPCVVSFLCGGR